ncbi:SDR family oxidoreductase [Hwanghaeella sp.]|uniref:SDR family oxidoreductase n=1 Tax=Hwanghaeella sp. TaxID=2605943 RepID=UPI003CCBCE9D
MDTDLSGKRAVITAGASGIGLATAKALQADGAQVFVCDVNEDSLANLPDGIIGARVDVANSAEIDAWLAPIVADGIDILVNNAGTAGPTAAVEDIDDEGWRSCLAVGLDSQFYCVRRVVPVMKKQKSGAIVNLTSTAGLFGFPNRSPYTAVKFAVVGLTKTWAMELGRDNIRVNAIAPGSVNGDRMDRVVAAHAKAEGVSEDHVRAMYTLGTSMACFVDAEEIADMVVYLCSDRGKRISGQIIAVDGNTETQHPRDLG